jgi:hypothetical protein
MSYALLEALIVHITRNAMNPRIAKLCANSAAYQSAKAAEKA